MKTFLCVLIFWGSLSPLLAQDSTVVTNFKDTVSVKPDTSYWQRSFSGGVNFNQASFSNWTGGGVNSVALGAVVAARALYTKANWSWDNTADLQLGFVTQNGLTRKAADQIMLNSVAGYKISPKIDWFGSATFSSFFATGYRYSGLATGQSSFKVSNFLAPGQLTLAWGVAYKPSDWFALRLSPFAPRFTFLSDQGVRFSENAAGIPVRNPNAIAYGVAPGKSIRTEWLAFQLQASLIRNLSENVNINARYLMYANYKTLDAIDHRIDLILTAKVNRYLSTTFGVIALFDKDFIDVWQLQQTLAIGLVYNVSSFRKK
ncbi:DUF3078 domain-containing protein [Spirosoma utsteinense]|uniref:DUF3078 domain-containing protein n=1 Tax=Spirosoma utsteinense TaxID=2585773 RepID=A0ABR6W6V7_9BACT|nr:DUF3078 domain-containing protein [Spirosoma utsteinense]MBC3786105.1 hypothetical protein [Spirosoma utsteinense]MBC3792294.1 hypothetical protein [Spirosoma utsteinense]